MIKKSPDAFRTISEVAEVLDVPPHVLRFWETRFTQVKPVKRGGGRRYYRPQDVQLLRSIRSLLYVDGMTIKGVQKILREKGIRHVMALVPDESDHSAEDVTPSVESRDEIPSATKAEISVEEPDNQEHRVDQDDLFEKPAAADQHPASLQEPLAAPQADTPTRKVRIKSLLAELQALRAVMLDEGR